MRLKILLLSLIFSSATFLGMAGNVYAHADHDHTHSQEIAVDSTKAEENATKLVAELVKREQLEVSWSSITASSVEEHALEGRPEWLVVFENNAVADINKQKLYVFLTIGGEYIAANYTGE